MATSSRRSGRERDTSKWGEYGVERRHTIPADAGHAGGAELSVQCHPIQPPQPQRGSAQTIATGGLRLHGQHVDHDHRMAAFTQLPCGLGGAAVEQR